MVILGKRVVYSGQYLDRVKVWIKGWVNIPGGTYIWGYTGKETEVEADAIKTLHTFEVSD